MLGAIGLCFAVRNCALGKIGQPNVLLPSLSYACAKLECYNVCSFALILKAYVEVYIIALYSIIVLYGIYCIALSSFIALLSLDLT